MSLLADMAELLPGSRLTRGRDTSRLVFEVDGCWLDARARTAPVIEVFIRTLDLPGLELRVGPDGFEPEADDDPLVALWLDPPARTAFDGWTRGYRFVLDRGEVLVTRRNELEPERLAAAVRAGGVLAARPHRIARAWLEVARALGGTTTSDRWDLGRDFAVTVDRSPVTVQIDNLGAPLRTRCRAVRLGGTDDVDPLAPHAALLAAALPDDTSVDRGAVELRWAGLMMDPARLGPAVEICARLAAPSIAATGPYR